MRAVDKIASCEIAFIPVESSGYIGDVNRVLDIIKASGLEHSVGTLSTVIKGEKDGILGLINKIYESMDGICNFVMDIRISNICGCK